MADFDIKTKVQWGKTRGDTSLGTAWTLASGKGSRYWQQTVTFAPAFSAPPVFAVWLSSFDIKNKCESRLSAQFANLTATSVDISVSTWVDSAVSGAEISWIAFDSTLANTNGSRICTGRSSYKTKQSAGYNLCDGTGDRAFADTIKFPFAFSTPPKVFIAFATLDFLQVDDNRLSLVVNSTAKETFDLGLSTWNKTKVWSTAVTWIAFEDAFTTNHPELQFFTGRQPFKRTLPGYSLDKSQNLRVAKQHITLQKAYSAEPAVLTGICLVDTQNSANHRLASNTSSINQNGFDIEASTWRNSLVWGTSLTWFTVGKAAKPLSSSTTSSSSSSSTTAASTSPVAAPSGEKKDDDANLCKICYDDPINTVIVPCGHLAVCTDCAKSIHGHGKKNLCPICNTKITTIVQTFQT